MLGRISTRLVQPTLARSLHSTPPRLRSGLVNLVGDPEEFTTTHVHRITAKGIELSDGLLLPGPCILMNGRVFLWDVKRPEDIWNTDLFAPFEVVVPKPELVIVGTGARTLQPPPRVRTALNEMGLALDIMDTRNACSTFNLLLEEGRRVAAALVPPSSLPWR
ncbi:DUF498-domain-containing protein [Auricularia subglabra TFB-10046 SS5]|nr:DUF498-domain-containing protein [Auricularia subglabra TFB-10046 SS5]